MKIHCTILLEKLEELLKEYGDVISSYEEKKRDFFTRTIIWLDNAQQILKQFSLNEYAQIASVKGAIIAANNGVFNNLVNIDNSKSSKKVQQGVIVLEMNKAQAIVQKLSTEYLEKTRVAIEILNPIVFNVVQEGIIVDSNYDFEDLQSLWQKLLKEPSYRNNLKHILLHVSYYDGLRLFDSILNALFSDSDSL